MGVPQLREEVQRVDTYLRQLSAGLGRVALAPQGSGPVGGNSGQTTDLSQFWYLPGRLPEQRAYGRNVMEGISVSAQGSGTPTVSQRVGIFAFDQDMGIPNVWLGVEGTDHALVNPSHANRPYHGNRYWVFPAFNQLAQGETSGLHYFADTSDYQVLQHKTLSSWVLETADSSGIGIVESTNRGETESGTTRALQLLFHGSFPTTTWKRTLTDPSGGSYPAIAFPPLDVNAGVTAPTREKQHILCVMRKDHTDTSPFEPGGLLMGGNSGRELYPLFTTAQGTLTAPTDGSFPLWHPVVSQSCTFTTSSAVVTMASTTGIQKGMRMRETTASYSLLEDTHVVSVDSPTQITMSTNWPASNLVRTVEFFGMTWSDSATSITLGAGALTDYLYLPGRATGQRIGTATQTGNSDDIASSGRLSLGTTAFGTDQMLTINRAMAGTASTTYTMVRMTPNVSASGSVGAAKYNAFLTQVTGGSSITGGAPSFIGAQMSVSPNFGSNVSPVDIIGLEMTSSATVTGSLTTVGLIAGLRAQARAAAGATILGDTYVYNEITGIRAVLSQGGGGKVTELNGIKLGMDQTNKSFNVSNRDIAVNMDLFGDTSGTAWGTQTLSCTVSATSPILSAVVNNIAQVGMYITGTGIPANTYVQSINTGAGTVTMTNNATANGTSVTLHGTCTNWSGLYRTLALPIGSVVVTARFFDLQADIPSQHYGYFYVRPANPNNYPAPTAYLHLGAGVATATGAPLKFDVGTNLTAPEAGAIEYDGTAWYMTHADAVRGVSVTQRGAVDLTAQTAAIGATTIYTPPQAGYYVVHYTIEDTTADVTAGTIQFQVNYTDDVGATNQTGAALALTATGRDRGSFTIYSASGVISYQTNLVGIMGTAQYALRVRLTYLG